jgi:hypothetical protein
MDLWRGSACPQGTQQAKEDSAAHGVVMKKLIVFSLLASFAFAGLGFAQTKSDITVKGAELNNGVVLISVVRDGKAFELSCNQGATSCVSLKGGKYLLVELPPNHGMYECRDVEVYAAPAPGEEPTKKLGEYCLAEK